MNVGVLGWGALGSAIGSALADGKVPEAHLTAVGLRGDHVPASVPAPVVEPAELCGRCDVVVEAATHDAVRDYVPSLIDAGCRVMVLSTGAFRDRELFDRLVGHAGRRLIISTGAIGGIDILRACRQIGGIRRVTLTTTKPPAVLVQAWMNDDMTAALQAGDQVVECFRGPAVEAAERFPTSVNVAATLALAAGSWDLVDVTVVGDPAATGNRHRIEIDAVAGSYAIDVDNAALASNPRSSALVVGSALRGLEVLAADCTRFL